MKLLASACRLGAVCALLMAAGCAQLHLGAPTASLENIQAARGAGLVPMAVGEFELAAGTDRSVDQGLSVRTNTVYSPYGNSLAKYLRETLRTELAAAGLEAPAADVLVRGLLLESRLDVPSGPASASLGARFIVTRRGQVVYERDLRATDAWQASFIGVDAIPQAMSRYTLLHRALVRQLLDDPAFRTALRRP